MSNNNTMAFNAAYGSMLGAAVGDAAGATLEFLSKGQITRKVVAEAMTMPGGGKLAVGPGQITDDTELQICLGSALTSGDAVVGMPLKLIKELYGSWLSSDPFDVGNTCRKAFGGGRLDKKSEANGALMRCTPIAVFAYKQPYDIIAKYARQDARLSHPHQNCQDANAAYCVAIAHLINHHMDSEGAIEAARSVLGDECDVRSWLDEAVCGCPLTMDCTNLIGYVKWGFMLAFYHLKSRSSYTYSIADTLHRGGDTDTNAAIVGGMTGALNGESTIPDFMKRPVLAYTFDATQAGNKRPAFLNSSRVHEIATKLMG
jgi:ADP-ribosylglycohydrolase